ncbi:MAG: hypothetical protein ABIK28_24870, partial [Planctomycetota bacterium]
MKGNSPRHKPSKIQPVFTQATQQSLEKTALNRLETQLGLIVAGSGGHEPKTLQSLKKLCQHNGQEPAEPEGSRKRPSVTCRHSFG